MHSKVNFSGSIQILSKEMLADKLNSEFMLYIHWDDFVKYPNADIKQAFGYREKTPTYKIKKSL